MKIIIDIFKPPAQLQKYIKYKMLNYRRETALQRAL